MKKTIIFVSLVCFSFLVNACGGGGASGLDPEPPVISGPPVEDPSESSEEGNPKEENRFGEKSFGLSQYE